MHIMNKLMDHKEMVTPRLRAKVAVNDGDGTARVVNVEERRWS